MRRRAMRLSNGLGSREVERAMGIELTRAVPRELENKWLVRQRIPSVMSV
jgi:hypothetical protein